MNSSAISHPAVLKSSVSGHVSSDPLVHYQSICDSCGIIKEERKQEKAQQLAMKNGPQPYDNDHLLQHNLHACFTPHDVLRCKLEPIGKDQPITDQEYVN